MVHRSCLRSITDVFAIHKCMHGVAKTGDTKNRVDTFFHREIALTQLDAAGMNQILACRMDLGFAISCMIFILFDRGSE